MAIKSKTITRTICDCCEFETTAKVGDGWSTLEWYAGKHRPQIQPSYEMRYNLDDNDKITKILLCPECTPKKKRVAAVAKVAKVRFWEFWKKQEKQED